MGGPTQGSIEGIGGGVGGTTISSGTNFGDISTNYGMSLGPGMYSSVMPGSVQISGANVSSSDVRLFGFEAKVLGVGVAPELNYNAEKEGIEITIDAGIVASGSGTIGYSPKEGFYYSGNV
jgi:hypothetical protein